LCRGTITTQTPIPRICCRHRQRTRTRLACKIVRMAWLDLSSPDAPIRDKGSAQRFVADERSHLGFWAKRSRVGRARDSSRNRPCGSGWVNLSGPRLYPRRAVVGRNTQHTQPKHDSAIGAPSRDLQSAQCTPRRSPLAVPTRCCTCRLAPQAPPRRSPAHRPQRT